MSERETIDNLQTLATAHRLLTRAIAELENDLCAQRKERPHNIPYIVLLETRLKTLRINQQHIRDRVDKVDGCF